jgi:hypothetical protein
VEQSASGVKTLFPARHGRSELVPCYKLLVRRAKDEMQIAQPGLAVPRNPRSFESANLIGSPQDDSKRKGLDSVKVVSTKRNQRLAA